MPRIQRPTSPTQLAGLLVRGLGIVALIPIVVLGGLAAVLVGVVATTSRALRSSQRPARPAPRVPAHAPLRILHDEPRAVLAAHRAA